MRKNIIIFGGAGFIGTHLKNYLKETTDYNVLSFDLIKTETDNFIDVRNKIEINHTFSSDDIIFILAAIHRTPGHKDYEYFETNIKGAENICAFAEEHGINNIIFTSSIAPYGTSEDLKSEDMLPTPNTPYGISKLTAEYIQRIWQAKQKEQRKLLIIRAGVVFGKGENGNNTRLFKSIKGNAFFYPGRKDTIKASVYVKDFVRLAIEIFNSYNNGVRLYNFTYCPAYSIEQIVESMSEIAGKKPPKLVINGSLLKFAAAVLGFIGFKKLGIHPDRVKKLMISTNIDGHKLIEDNFSLQYDLKSALNDWYADCDQKGLF